MKRKHQKRHLKKPSLFDYELKSIVETSNRLERIVKNSGLRKYQFADRIQIPPSTLSSYLTGKRELPRHIQQRVIKEFSQDPYPPSDVRIPQVGITYPAKSYTIRTAVFRKVRCTYISLRAKRSQHPVYMDLEYTPFKQKLIKANSNLLGVFSLSYWIAFYLFKSKHEAAEAFGMPEIYILISFAGIVCTGPFEIYNFVRFRRWCNTVRK